MFFVNKHKLLTQIRNCHILTAIVIDINATEVEMCHIIRTARSSC